MKRVLFLLCLTGLAFACSDDSDSAKTVSGCNCIKYVEINEHFAVPGEQFPIEWKLLGTGQPVKYSEKCEDDGQIVFYDENTETFSGQTLITQTRQIVRCTNNQATN